MSVCAVVAADPVHEEMSWLNAEADKNILPISVTLLCVPTPNVLVERRSGIKHTIHISHFLCVPIPNVLVERRSGIKHISHSSHFPCVPLRNVAVECTFSTKALSTSLPSYPLISSTKLVSQFGIVPYQTSCDRAQSIHSPVSAITADSSKHSATKVCQLASGIGEGPTHEFAGPVTALVHLNFA